MKHLLASCAVVALMAAPALAQSTSTLNDPPSDTETIVDPTTVEETDVVVDAEVESDTDMSITMAPETEAEIEDEVAEQAEMDAEEDSDQAMTAESETDLVFQTQTEDASTESVVETATVETPIDVAELPADYETQDLNALMLAQLNEDAAEIASITFEANTYASAEASEDTASATEDYASTDAAEATPSETEMVPETYASSEVESRPEAPPFDEQFGTAMVPVAPALEDEAVEMADESDETVVMAELQADDTIIAQGDIDQNAVEIASGDDRFSTLVELVGLADLEDELSLDGPYTVFAPTNEAFAALPEETLARLKSEEGKGELASILKAHVVEGAVMAPDVPLAGQEVDTLADTTAVITGSMDGSLYIQGSTTIGDGIYASNGVVYAVDAVILPEATPEPVAEDTEG